jgi:hypothetical protein
MKVHIVGGDMLIQRMFEGRGHTVVAEAAEADILCFTGGSDVHPAVYGNPMHHTSRCNYDRDMAEKRVFEEYRDIPKVGICRGAQFLNVMSGGIMWQDVDQHAMGKTHKLAYSVSGKYDYKVDPEDDNNPNFKYESVEVTSTHHQMMCPDKKTSELWAWCNRSRYRDYGGQDKARTNTKFSPDVEIVWYEGTKSLCFQPHPEYGVKSCEDLFFTCVERAYPQFAAKGADLQAA